MKIVQTTLTDSEHKLLQEYAIRNSKTIKQVVKEAIRMTVIDDKVSRADPIFSEAPSAKKTGRSDDASIKHDSFLYGVKHSH